MLREIDNLQAAPAPADAAMTEVRRQLEEARAQTAEHAAEKVARGAQQAMMATPTYQARDEACT